MRDERGASKPLIKAKFPLGRLAKRCRVFQAGVVLLLAAAHYVPDRLIRAHDPGRDVANMEVPVREYNLDHAHLLHISLARSSSFFCKSPSPKPFFFGFSSIPIVRG